MDKYQILKEKNNNKNNNKDNNNKDNDIDKNIPWFFLSLCYINKLKNTFKYINSNN